MCHIPTPVYKVYHSLCLCFTRFYPWVTCLTLDITTLMTWQYTQWMWTMDNPLNMFMFCLGVALLAGHSYTVCCYGSAICSDLSGAQWRDFPADSDRKKPVIVTPRPRGVRPINSSHVPPKISCYSITAVSHTVPHYSWMVKPPPFWL